MKITSDIYLDVRRKNTGGNYYVKIRVTFNRKQKYYPTDVSLSQDEFDHVMGKPKGQFKTVRLKIDKHLEKVRNAIEKIPQFSFSALELEINKVHKSAMDIFPYFRDRYLEYMGNDQIKTASLYRTTMNSLKNFKPSISFYDITPQFLSQYSQYMQKKGISPTTVGIYLRHLRAIYNQGVQDGIVKGSTNPFGKRGFKIPHPRKGKEGLSLEQIKDIFNTRDFHSVAEETARDFWMLFYLCNGANPSDLLRLRWSDKSDNAFQLIRKKTARSSTGGLPVIIYLKPETLYIVDKYGDPKSDYIFGVLRENMSELEKKKAIENKIRTTNKYMKRLAARLNINIKCTTGVARHTFAQVLKHSNVSIDLISEAMGHSSIKITNSYLNSFKLDKMKEVADMLL